MRVYIDFNDVTIPVGNIPNKKLKYIQKNYDSIISKNVKVYL